MTTPSLVLALSSGEIVSIVIAVLVIVSGIMGQANEAKKNQQRRQKKRGDQLAGEQGSASALDDIAQRRRAQLEALARQRRPGSTGAVSEMAAAQQAQRDSTRPGYEAPAMTTQPDQLNTMLTRGEASGRAQADMDAERAAQRQVRRAQKQEQERLAREQRALRKQQAREQARGGRRRQVARQAPSQPVAPHGEALGTQVSSRAIGLADLGRGATSVDTVAHDEGYETEEVHRHVSDVATVQVDERKSRLAGMMVGRSWRDVLLLKEVLDPPLSMREDTGRPSDPWE